MSSGVDQERAAEAGTSGQRGSHAVEVGPLYLLKSNPLSQGGANRYWESVYNINGASGQQLKDIMLADHTGMGVVSALVATIIVSCLLLSTSSYREDNDYNEEAHYVYVGLLILSLVFTISTITLSFELVAQTLKVPPEKMLWWVKQFKGNVRFEAVVHMYASLWTLLAAVVCMVYLLYGGPLFFACLGMVVVAYIVIGLGNMEIQAKLMQGVLFSDDANAAAGGSNNSQDEAQKGANGRRVVPTSD